MNDILTAGWLTVPLILSGVLHMVVVKTDAASRLAVPMSRSLFGSHKTWRGFLFVPLATALATWALALVEPSSPVLRVRLDDGSTLLLGLVTGLGYVVAELPNSWLKRRLGIAPGQLPSRHAFWFASLDQLDSAIGSGLGYALMRHVPWTTLITLVLFGPVVKVVMVYLLYLVGLRKRPL
jgi:CDP-diacylglycerol--serine O-phosphatidyltransferase